MAVRSASPSTRRAPFGPGSAPAPKRSSAEYRAWCSSPEKAPPRSGAQGIARWAKGFGARRLVYVACDPASLARDAAELKQQGFTPVALQLFDMFPQTHHVEAVMRFDR